MIVLMVVMEGLAKHAHLPASVVVQMHAKHITNTQTAQQGMKQITVAHLYATLANAQEDLAKHAHQAAPAVVQMHAKHITNT